MEVFQIGSFDTEMVNALSRAGFSREQIAAQMPAYGAYMRQMMGSLEFLPSDFKFYSHVATVKAGSLDEAFRLMNLWDDESKVEIHLPCRSLSVGDILLHYGVHYMVCPVGFTPVTVEGVM